MKTILFAICLAFCIGLVTYVESRAVQLETPQRAALSATPDTARR